MFDFVVKYLGFLKHITLFAQFYDASLKLTTLLFNPKVLDCVDAIEAEVTSWPNMSVQLHKFGGVQFNFNNKEVGHIHGNGMLDLLLNRKAKSELLIEGRVRDHHTFKDSGWITFVIRTANDYEYALGLLKFAIENRKKSIACTKFTG
jgi:Family of unknown function (DUF5519)